ncbi:peptidoglycan DD-metalloendopeptidase family protein [Deinococcus detaillensis]|uniref:peptidoglycan DD-metalloendopeptidase family protein n=1 Tax=Deinococcus detaillensis TaxID=2592048 RepID=UPI001CDC11FE|nr:peptidoglycan DD-metalloendopeptidase family protein [Deinococcus detaillensis]
MVLFGYFKCFAHVKGFGGALRHAVPVRQTKTQLKAAILGLALLGAAQAAKPPFPFLAAAPLADPLNLTRLKGVQVPAAFLIPKRAALPTGPSSALVIAQSRERPGQIAERYGVGLSALKVLRGGAEQTPSGLPLRAGQVVRVALRLTLPVSRRPSSIKTVTVAYGDTLSHLMQRSNLSERELISANLELGSLDKLAVGTRLNIPTAETGLLIRIKPGQTAADLIAAYHAAPLAVARANAIKLPTELSVGDELLLPGIYADSLHEELLARRLRAIQQAKAAVLLAQYQQFEAWKAARLAERQRRFDAYQTWLKSPERLALIAKYQRQAQYDAWTAQQAAEAAAKEAEYQAFLTQQAAEDATRTQQIKTQMLDLASSDPRPQMQAALSAEQNAPDLHLRWPLEHPRLTSRFGEEDIEFHVEQFHGGLDMVEPTGTPIYAAQAGEVTKSGEGAYGINVYTVDADLNLAVVYGHLSQTAVETGQSVKQGDLIGYVGCTGECTGPHLHFELRLGGTPVDPLAFLP